jgi:hypothetical protein
MTTAPTVYREWKRSRGEVTRLVRQEFNGHDLLHLRNFYLDKDGKLKPTAQGVTIPHDQIAPLRKALRQKRNSPLRQRRSKLGKATVGVTPVWRSNPMNRQTRRAAKAMARHTPKPKYHQIVAVHEAGHAVAKVMTAPDFGYEVHEAVAYIDVGSREPCGLTPDGKMILRSQAVTYGPTFSKEISLAAAEFKAAFFADRTSLTVQGNDSRELFCGILNAAQTAGADIKMWFRIRAFDAVAGCVAEANFSKRDFGELFFQDYATEGDRRDIAHDARMAAIPASEATLLLHTWRP